MSKHFLLNSFCITVLGVFAGYSVTHVVLESNHGLQSRDVASINQGHTLSKLASQQVYQDYFDVRIKHEHFSKKRDEQSTVKAVITAKKDLPAGLSFRWVLGQDVQVTSSELTGTLHEIKQGESQEVFLNVYGFNKQQKTFLSFEVKGTVDNHLLVKETLSSSRPEDSFEYVVQQAHEAEVKAAASDKKINDKLSVQSATSKKFSLENIVK